MHGTLDRSILRIDNIINNNINIINNISINPDSGYEVMIMSSEVGHGQSLLPAAPLCKSHLFGPSVQERALGTGSGCGPRCLEVLQILGDGLRV